ncbi:MAG TPA: glycine zipper domain-containing protein [Devosia sp.]|nr:glycine zipper domain-containing protein [Devosia sp.]
MKTISLIIAALLTAFTLSACTSTQRAAGAGAVIGGVIGGVTTGSPQGAAAGAIVGGASGAIAGTLLGRQRDNPDRCVYEDRYGRRFVDVCPRG